MPNAETICLGCGQRLVTEGLPTQVAMVCAHCRRVFQLAGQPAFDLPPLSRKALASLALGMSSVFGILLTGLPAIVLGVWALRDIGRSPTRLRGRAFAIGGIVSGLAFSLFCGSLVMLIALSVYQTTNAFQQKRESLEAGRLLAREQRWGEAAAKFTQVGLHKWDGELCDEARLRFAAGDTAGYQEVCQTILGRRLGANGQVNPDIWTGDGRSEPSYMNVEFIRVWTLGPAAVQDTEKVLHLARTYIDSRPEGERTRSDNRLLLVASLYRAGHEVEARRECEHLLFSERARVRGQSSTSREGLAAQVWLALMQNQEGHPERAQRTLAQVKPRVAIWLAEKRPNNPDWQGPLELELLLREAQQHIGANVSASPVQPAN